MVDRKSDQSTWVVGSKGSYSICEGELHKFFQILQRQIEILEADIP
jgi:hypothetical protein